MHVMSDCDPDKHKILLMPRGQAIHNAKIELHNIEVENRILKDALSR